MMVRRSVLAVASAAALVVALGACSDAEPGESPGATRSGSPGAGTPGGPGGTGPDGGAGLGEAPPPPEASETGTVAVYYLGDEEVVTEGGTQQRLRLYREFHRLDVADGTAASRVAAAVGHMLSAGSALDPDYHGGWPEAATVRDVEVDGTVATVDIGAAATHDAGAEGTGMALQELVWTATADPDVDAVRLLLDGEPAGDLWGHVSVPDPVARGPVSETVALLWLISPQHGQELPGTFEVHVYGAPFEATAQLRVRQGATVVDERTLSLGGAGFPDFFGEAKVDLTLDPGTYTLEVYESSAVDGSEVRVDDKEVTVG